MFKLEERTLASFLLWHPRTLYYSLLVFPIQDDTGEKVPFFPIREGVLLFIPVFSAAPQPLLAASLNSSFQHIKELQLGRRQGRGKALFSEKTHLRYICAEQRLMRSYNWRDTPLVAIFHVMYKDTVLWRKSTDGCTSYGIADRLVHPR